MLNSISSVAPFETQKIICDTGASNTYFKPEHKQFLQNYEKLLRGPQAALPNNEKITATHQGNLILHPSIKLKALIFPKLINESLLFIGQLYDKQF